MPDDKVLEDTVKLLIIDICRVMHLYGYQKVRMGNIMRLLGMDSNAASKYDEDFIVFDQTFNQLVNQVEEQFTTNIITPASKTIH